MKRAILALLTLVTLASCAQPTVVDPHRDLRDELRTLNTKLRSLAGPRDTIVLVTMGVGSLIWERHGHIALCVLYANPQPGRVDECYNYGVATFDKPLGMAWGFFRGTHSFWVAKDAPYRMLHVYLAYDRTIYAQPLTNLTDKQVEEVITQLEHDVRDENKFYAYDHFDDNCTTRARDILDRVTGGELMQIGDLETDGKTFRDLAREGFYGMRVPLIVTDLAMGRSTDRVPTYWDKMFLPQYLREAAERRWSIKPIEIYKRLGPDVETDGPSGRVLFALLLILLTAPAWATRLWGRFERAGLIVALAPQLLLGTVFWMLALISPLPYVRWNETCLVLLPADILLVAFLSQERRILYAKGRIVMLVLVAVLGLVGVLKQPLLAPILWPLIPCAVVAFLPRKQKKAEAKADGKAEASTDDPPKLEKATGSKKKKR
ncbi:MAG: DUF4105 domain-containing protein [Deltaproteobacteria bacterium]|nr:DUF4105 domain-containing protein [Deltaproteobacteria bacterium]